jgi:rSAM/selenodomain-associated transferase 1
MAEDRAGCICVFAKDPIAGQVKTRLAAALGDEPAACLARAFLEDALALASATARRVVVAWSGELARAPRGIDAWPQGEGDLGVRLERIFQRALEVSPWTIALGADSPGLPLAYLERAIGALEGEDVDAVIGPADDGGYYLLGLRVCPRGALREIAWSTLRTRADTRASLDRHGLRVQEIDAFFDVDEIADLERLRAMLDRGEARAPKTARALAELRGAR